ncbi:hypothetical protein [Streptomyces scabiei]|uniref:hypothetical protein n=1 Tax=Streptomyces scabiei TaxID=1930 RepID=UPI00131ECB10|nr:hypothetical protein [Streptomyces scabiei]
MARQLSSDRHDSYRVETVCTQVVANFEEGARARSRTGFSGMVDDPRGSGTSYSSADSTSASCRDRTMAAVRDQCDEILQQIKAFLVNAAKQVKDVRKAAT